MYLEVSEALKATVKSRVITTKARLTFKNFFSDSSDLIIDKDISSEGLNLVDCCYDEENGKLIGTAALKEVEIEINNKNGYDLADKEFELEVGVLINRETLEYEYIPYGRYIVVSYEDLKSSNKYKIIANDMMCKLNPLFKENEAFKPIYPISAKDYYRQFMASYGIEIEEQVLPNEDFIIKTAMEFGENTGRYVLGRLAELFGSFAKINRKNKCQMYLKTETDEVMELSQMNSTLEIDKRYGPVNTVTIGMSQVEGENVTLEDKAAVLMYGATTIRIDDNEFLYTEELREKAIQPLFERLRGFTYIPVKFKHKALLYTDCGDSLQVRNMADGELVDTIILNQYVQIPRTRQSSIESPALTNAEQKYKYISNSKQAQTETEIRVNKQDQIIESVVSQTTEQNEKINRITQTVDELNSKISDVADLTKSAENNKAKLEFEDINEGEPIRIIVHPLIDHISYLYPSNVLFPSDYLHTKSRILRFENKETNEIIDYEIPDNLFYHDEETYDEFILDYDSQTCLINKRVGFNAEDGTTYVLDNVITTEYEYPKILLASGDYIISIYGYDAGYLFVRLMSQNIYTTQFATKAELSSEISQTKKDITLTVDEKLLLYPTTEQMTSAISISAKEINQQVSKKVGSEEIIAKINLAVKDKQGVIDITGNQVTIESDDFKLKKNGEIEATAGKIANWNVEKDHFYAQGQGLFRPTMEDAIYALSMTQGIMEKTNFYKFLFDVDNDGQVTVMDIVKMRNQASGTAEPTKTVNGKVEINTDNPTRAIVLTNTDTNTETVIGVVGISAERITAKSITANTIELGAGTLLMEIAGYKTKVIPASSYTHNHLFQFDYNGNGVGGRPTLKTYVDTTFVGDFPAVLPNHKYINTPEANGSGIYILTSKQTYLEVQDGNNTYMIPYNTSDSKMKDNMVKTDVKALEVVDKIKHYSFDWKHNGEHQKIGYKADELYEQDEMLATRLKQQDGSYLHQFNSNNILALCTKSIQELNAKIEKRDKIIEFLAEKLGCKDEVLEMLKEGD